MRIPTRRVRAATLVATAALLLAACADDADDAASPSAPRESASPTPTASVEDFCDAKLAIDAAFLGGGPPEEEEGATPDPEAIGENLDQTFSALYADLAEAAPEEVAEDVDALVGQLDAAIEEGNEEFFLAPDFAGAEAVVDEYLLENCDYQELSATAADFEFNDLDMRIDPGPTAITLTNEGEEFHEILLLRINDDVDLSPEEIVALPEEEAMSKVSPPAAVVLTVPDQQATSFYELEEGRYAVVCFISKDSTEENDFQGEGPPHVTEGMVEELFVGDVASPEPSADAGEESSDTGSSDTGSSDSGSSDPSPSAEPSDGSSGYGTEEDSDHSEHADSEPSEEPSTEPTSDTSY